jgi:hypothetical protein
MQKLIWTLRDFNLPLLVHPTMHSLRSLYMFMTVFLLSDCTGIKKGIVMVSRKHRSSITRLWYRCQLKILDYRV